MYVFIIFQVVVIGGSWPIGNCHQVINTLCRCMMHIIFARSCYKANALNWQTLCSACRVCALVS